VYLYTEGGCGLVVIDEMGGEAVVGSSSRTGAGSPDVYLEGGLPSKVLCSY